MRRSAAIACLSFFAFGGCASSGSGTPATRGSTALSTYVIASVPPGLAVQNGGVALGVTQPAGNAPLTFTPPFSGRTLRLTISPANGAPLYVYAIDQPADGPHEIFYNQSADSAGSIGTIATAALGRTSDATEYREPRFAPPSLRGLPAYSSTRLEVRYDVAALRAAGAAPAEVERARGVTRAVALGLVSAGTLTRVLDVPAGASPASLAARLREARGVVSAEPVGLRYLAGAPVFMPNDTHFNAYQQWDMFDVLAPNAWSLTKGEPLLALGGSGVSIAVLDTGADAGQRDLAAKVVFAESVLDGVVTRGAGAAQDTDGHGTDVSGIAAADTDNAFGYAGIGFRSTLQIYKIFPNRSGSGPLKTDAADEAQAIYDAVANGARVINMSLAAPQGSAGFDPVERDAVEYAIAKGVSVVAAAGNDRAGGATTVEYPAAYDGVVSVGATSLDDAATPGNPAGSIEYVASYSNSGPNLTLVAPGGDPSRAEQTGGARPDDLHWIENIYTTTPADPKLACLNIDDCQAFYAGTSQAAPHVSGAVALMLAQNPALSPSQIVTILETSSDDIGDPNQGHGRLDAFRAVAAAGGATSGVPLPGNADFVAFAYVPAASAVPQIVDVTYPKGVAVASDGTFRIADVPATAPSYKIGVWADLNGDGRVDAGDYFGSSGFCSANAPCAGAKNITVHPVAPGFVLQ